MVLCANKLIEATGRLSCKIPSVRKETPNPAAVFSDSSKGMFQALIVRKTDLQQRLDSKFWKSLAKARVLTGVLK